MICPECKRELDALPNPAMAYTPVFKMDNCFPSIVKICVTKEYRCTLCRLTIKKTESEHYYPNNSKPEKCQ